MRTERQRALTGLGLTAPGGTDPVVTGLSLDSREVAPGHLFAALPGTKVHGAAFAQAALRAGAAAILTDRAGAEMVAGAGGRDVPVVIAEDPREALAFAAALWFGRQPEIVTAVTGTNGKTSVAAFARQIWTLLGIPAVNIGTTGVEGYWTAPLAHTTPEPITLHRTLADAAEQGVDHAAMEASSHGLAQRRMDGVRLAAAAFTNLSHDHLDYHADAEDYFRAKLRLFTHVLPEDGIAVINTDSHHGRMVETASTERGQEVIRVGRSEDAHLRIRALRFDPTGQELRYEWNGQAGQTRLDLIGGFQAENVLVAAGLAIAGGCDPAQVFGALRDLDGVRGRMQHVATRENGAAVFVDYAHTPGAVAAALRSLRPHVMGRIVVVVGAGGDRDRGKRPMMGQAAADNADAVIVTDDNPRGEIPAAIRAAVMGGAPQATEVGDRAEAILMGVDALGPGDALLIAGKGHETGQIVGDTIFPFDDAEQASVAVAALDGRVA